MIQVADDLLAVLAASPDVPDRWERELALRTGRARAMTLLRGYTVEAEAAYVEALAIAKDHGTVPQQFPVLRALASFHGFRGEFDKGIEYAHEIMRLADAQGDMSMRVDGLFLLGAHSGFTGDLASGLGYLDQAIEQFETAGYRPRRLRFGIDTRVACLASTGFFLWFSGYPDRAVERAERAVAIATDLEHPYSLAYALYHSGFLHLWRGESELVRDRAAAARIVADASDSPIWRALATCLAGAATSMLGRPVEGLRQMDDGLDQYGGLRTPPVFWPMIRFMQASAHVHAGTAEPGFALIDEALAVEGQDTIDSAIFHVVRGDLSLLDPGRDPAAATSSYEKAYAVASRFGEPMPQLRAAVRLCRIADDDNRAARLETLRAVHATFTEGHATPDLVEAAELLGG
jgi:tetratricopeptide (TPR) repeat protein